MDLSRRDMILSAGAATLLAPSSAVAQPTTARRVGWAVLGLGNFAGLNLPKFRLTPNARLAALISGSPEKLARIGAEYQIAPDARYSYDDWNRIKNDDRIQAIYIATPVGTHVDFALEAIKAGKDVLVEKTLVESSTRARMLIDTARAAGRKLGVAYRVWHDPANQLLMQVARSGELGRVTTVMADKGFTMQLPASNWRFDPRLSGGGVLVDVGIYNIQAARYVTGEEPIEVQATAWSDPADSRYRRVEQTIVSTLCFPSGALATATASWDYRGQNRIVTALQKGSVTLDPATFWTTNEISIGRSRDGRFGTERPSLPPVDQLAAQIEHFSNAILTNSPPMTDGVEGLKDILVVEALYRAASSRRSERVEIV